MPHHAIETKKPYQYWKNVRKFTFQHFKSSLHAYEIKITIKQNISLFFFLRKNFWRFFFLLRKKLEGKSYWNKRKYQKKCLFFCFHLRIGFKESKSKVKVFRATWHWAEYANIHLINVWAYLESEHLMSSNS